MRDCISLTELNLGSGYFCARGYAALADFLLHNRSLQRLAFSFRATIEETSQSIDGPFCQALVKAIAQHPSLQMINEWAFREALPEVELRGSNLVYCLLVMQVGEFMCRDSFVLLLLLNCLIPQI